MQKIKLETKIKGGFILSLIILVIISVVSLAYLKRMADDAASTKHSQEVLTNLSRLLSDMNEAESGQRGYAITGKDEFLTTCLQVMPNINITLQRLKVLTSDNPYQQKQLETIEPIIAKRLEITKSRINIRRTEGFNAVQTEISTGIGKHLQDDIRNLVENMQNEEARLMQDRDQKSVRSTRFTRIAIIIANLLAFIFVAAALSIILLDFTRRKQVEEEIKNKNTELQKLNAEKDKFFSIIAHDLKSPFNGILGFSNLLIEQVREKDYSGIEKYAEIIRHSSERAMELLMNLMEWARSQTGRIEFNPEYFEMVSHINEITSIFDDIAGQKSVSISKILPPIAPVFADKAMISTILRNLISNAIKFSYPGGEITIKVEENKNELTVSVSDNGVGISKNNIEKLFRIDENHSTPGTQKEKGTGLGLILCKEFVTKHSGKIWVESVVRSQPADKDGGTKVSFSIPF